MRRFDAACATLSRIKHPCDEVRERFAWVRELAANLRCITRLPEQLDAAAIAEAAAAADSTAADDSALMALRGGGASSSDIGPGAEQLAPRGRRNSAVRIAPPAARAQAPDALRGNSRATTSAGGAQPRRAPSAHRAPS